MKITVTADTASPAVRDLLARLQHPVGMFKVWSGRIARKAQANALAKGGRNFWREIARDVRVFSVSNDGAVVGCSHVAAAQKQFGGTIRAKNAGALTIPIAPEAKGRRASEFLTADRKLFVLPGSNGVLGYADTSGFHALYVLRASVTQKADPWWPTDAEIEAEGLRAANAWLSYEGGVTP